MTTPAAVRAACLAALPSDIAALLLPDQAVLPRILVAEQLVRGRLGTDTALILAGTAPASYCYGDGQAALDLLVEAVTQYAAHLVCQQAQQILPQRERTGGIDIDRNLDWCALAAGHLEQAQLALNLLKEQAAVPALQLGRPALAAIDPDADPAFIRPLLGSGRLTS